MLHYYYYTLVYNQTDQKGWIFLFPVTKIHNYRYIQNLKRGMWGIY